MTALNFSAIPNSAHVLTHESAAALLGQYPCCFLYAKGATRRDGKIASGKDPEGESWQRRPRAATEWRPGTGVGVICGKIPESFPSAGLSVHCLDFDVPTETVAAEVEQWLLQYLGGVDKPGACLKRTGKPPKFAVPFVCPEPLKKAEYTTQKFFPAGMEGDTGQVHQLEVLGAGNQFVAYAIHPDTGQPYEWSALDGVTFDDTLHSTPPDELLKLTRDNLEAITAGFNQIMSGHGLVQKAARGKKAKPAQQEESFFSRVNSKAMHNLDKWFCSVFPQARPYNNGFRVASADLGRNLEEDISALPEGIQDFGEECGNTPIDVVLHWGSPATPKDAALWLCERLAINPEELGWNATPDRDATSAALQAAEALFSPPARGCLELPEGYLSSPLGALTVRASNCLEFPTASTALTLIAGASAAVSMVYAVKYSTGTAISPGLFAVVQQPPSMQKSRLLSMTARPYTRAVLDHNRRIRSYNDAQEKDMPLRSPTFDNATDATSAALDQYLATCAEGRFCIASAEQAAFQSLFPEKPGEFSSNNELLLKGWQGEYVSSMRKGRNAFRGIAYGAVVVIAQPGSAQRVFTASNGSGLAERFLYAAEPSPLGQRELHGQFVTRAELQPFEDAIVACVEEYSERIFAMPVDNQQALDPFNLTPLELSPEGYAMLMEARRKQEPRLGALAKQGELLQVGWLGKVETHTMKVAAVLHVINSRMQGRIPEPTIPTGTVATALELVKILGQHLENLLHDTGETGEAAEIDSVSDLLARRRPMTPRVLAQTLRKRHPFRAMGKEAYTRARARVDDMLDSGQLILNNKGEAENV